MSGRRERNEKEPKNGELGASLERKSSDLKT